MKSSDATPCAAAAIAVVIPVYNRADLVKRTLQSIAAQQVLPCQVVLVDNNSTDSTLAVLREWAAANDGRCGMRVTVVSEPRRGAAAARNAGLSHVEAEWVMHFDSDDVMLPGHVSRAAAAIEAHPEAQVIGWDVTLHRLNGNTKTLVFSDKDCLFHCIMHGTMASARYIARTALVRAAGGWDPSISLWDDVELGVRILMALSPAGRVVKLRGPHTVEVYAQAQSITGTSFSSRAEAVDLALERMSRSLPPEERWIVRLRAAIIAGNYTREGRGDLRSALMQRTLAAEPCRWRRILLRSACAYTAAGAPGAARIFRCVFG